MLKNANVKKCWEILKNVKQDEQDTEFLPYFPLICFPYFIIHFIPFTLSFLPFPIPTHRASILRMYSNEYHVSPHFPTTPNSLTLCLWE